MIGLPQPTHRPADAFPVIDLRQPTKLVADLRAVQQDGTLVEIGEVSLGARLAV